MRRKKIRVEQSFRFIFLITFLGGFINSYSFFVRGGLFVSMHTGNLARMGIAVYQNNMIDLWAALMPVIGCLIGCTIAQIIKHHVQKKSDFFQYQLSVFVEFVALFIAVFIPLTVSNSLVCFFLATTTGYQLSTFRTFEGAGHNTTIASGNIRTLGHHIGDCIVQKDAHSFFITFKYFFAVISFPIGAAFGAYLSNIYGQYAIAFGCFILIAVSMILYLAEKRKYKED